MSKIYTKYVRNDIEFVKTGDIKITYHRKSIHFLIFILTFIYNVSYVDFNDCLSAHLPMIIIKICMISYLRISFLMKFYYFVQYFINNTCLTIII